MPSDQIQWFPGHMAKTRRMIRENLSSVDAVIELLDARVPLSSRNPEISELTSGKPVLTLLNKSSLADPAETESWIQRFAYQGKKMLPTDCQTGEGISKIAPALRGLLADKIQRYEEKGMTGRHLRVMIVGIPNVGKSSLINRLCGGKRAKVEDRPGVTLNKQWVLTGSGFELLDMPGVLWPKFEDRTVGENLAATGAIKDDILDPEAIASALAGRLRTLYPDLLAQRYRLSSPLPSRAELPDYDLLIEIGRKRGFLMSGGEINTERTALMLLDEFRGGKIGRITLDPAEDRVHA